MGCLSQCRFSNWSQHEADHSTGKRPDPRSFCIQKTLQNIAHDANDPGTLDNNLMFSGHNAFRFAKDPFYSNGFIPDGEAVGRTDSDGAVEFRKPLPGRRGVAPRGGWVCSKVAAEAAAVSGRAPRRRFRRTLADRRPAFLHAGAQSFD